MIQKLRIISDNKALVLMNFNARSFLAVKMGYLAQDRGYCRLHQSMIDMKKQRFCPISSPTGP